MEMETARRLETKGPCIVEIKEKGYKGKYPAIVLGIDTKLGTGKYRVKIIIQPSGEEKALRFEVPLEWDYLVLSTYQASPDKPSKLRKSVEKMIRQNSRPSYKAYRQAKNV